ncbi:glycosyl transferase family 2 [Gloeothece citriformis PCC 7424]|uniref:Glycosyl transferase family 2 n=1 Tax=Gloeothece citriformis (strain PCC 7424) TaxID=65393 RepID=B7KBE7_GLOC7|nr:glycosyltransferase family 2 protein [Gloeothece citriformis]ACK71503.1 glycosyl transferase family 2 [Gloeothece citriformis PCC 7424]
MLSEATLAVISLVLLVFQGIATLILLSRLLKGPFRRPPLEAKHPNPNLLGTVSVVVPTLNEVERIDPCLKGLSEQSYEVREILVIDSHSTDGTPERVKEISTKDPRFRLFNDDPLPLGWVGRPWALHTGFLKSSPKSEWVLGIDADTQPQPGLIPSLILAAEEEGYDIVSLSPQFILEYPGEWWLQPALLMTLIYRFDSAGVKDQSSHRVMANGQCFLSRRSVLEKVGGYQSAASSFCDDVTLARYAANQGYKVGFLDGAKVIRVRMYEGFKDTWIGWGRSLDLKDASTPGQLWGDLGLLLLTQGLPLLLSIALGLCLGLGYAFLTLKLALGLNLCLVLIRFALLLAIYPSYYRCSSFSPASWLFWLSPLADPLAVMRIYLSAFTRPTQWRGRVYQ